MKNIQLFEELVMTFHRNIEKLYGLNLYKVSIYLDNHLWIVEKKGDMFHFRISGETLLEVMEKAIPVIKENNSLVESKINEKSLSK